MLNGEIFYTPAEAAELIERWREHQNTVRPHSSLGYRNQTPIGLDGGVDGSVITPEWIEQVLDTSVAPRIEGLRIAWAPLNGGTQFGAYVITVPQATSRAPHQAPDRKYYRRFEFQSVPMHDYEIQIRSCEI